MATIASMLSGLKKQAKSATSSFVETNPLSVIYNKRRREEAVKLAEFLSKHPNPVVRSIARTSGDIVKVATDSSDRIASGIKDVSDIVKDKNLTTGQKVYKAGRGTLNVARGVLTAPTVTTQPVISAISGSLPDKGFPGQVKRVLTGVQRGVTMNEDIGKEVEEKPVKILGADVDPLITAGSLVGFTRNPMWKAILPKTSRIASIFDPVSNKGKAANFVFSRLSKGGIEGLVQSWTDIPDDAPQEEAVKTLLTNIGFGAVAELGTDAALKTLGLANNKVTKEQLEKVGKYFTEVKRKAGVIVKNAVNPLTNQREDVPMWKYIAYQLMDKTKDTLEPKMRPGFANFDEMAKIVGDTQPKGVGEVTVPSQEVPVAKPGTTPQLSTPGGKTPVGDGQSAIQGGSSPTIIDPVAKITALLKEAKPMREQQEALYSAERAKRVGAIVGIGKSVKGEKGFYTQLGALKGELPKVEFERIKQGLKQEDIDSLYNMIEDKNILTPFEKITTKGALNKLLGVEGGQIPTEGEIKLMSEVFPPEMIKSILDKRPFIQKLWGGIQSALNIPRAAMATLDMSAPLRQGWMMLSRPKQFGKSLGTMFRSFAKEANYKSAMEEIQSRPTYLKMREAKLALTDIGSGLRDREEDFMSNFVEKIPLLGIPAKASNRAYSGFLNKLRADVFDDLVLNAEKQGRRVEGKLLEDIAKFVNNGTGRGDLPKFLKGSAPLLNATFFSPRLLASRLNTLNPVYYYKLDPFVRKEALKTLLGTTAISASVLGLSKLAGAEVGTDPRSADFGKIKVGNTRYDVLGGYQQYIKLASQLYTGEIVSSTTGRTITLGEGYKPMTRKDIIIRFFEGKESPIASFVTNLATGQTATGEKVRVSDEVISRFIPMMVQDMYDLYKEWGPKGVPMALPGFFGAGSQTYGKQEIVSGKNQVGEPVTAIRPVKDLSKTISDRFFGQEPIDSTKQFSSDAYLRQMKSMSPTERSEALVKIKSDPDLLKKFNESVEKVEKGITVDDENLKGMGVQNGDRAIAVVERINKLKTPEEKKAKLKEYISKKVVTEDVLKQIVILLSK